MSKMGYGYGSECHLLRWMGRHRKAFDNAVLSSIQRVGYRIEWFDFEFKPGQKRERNMEPLVKTKNVGRIEALLRVIIGIILMVSAFSIEGVVRWVAGLMGAVFILTAIFGY